MLFGESVLELPAEAEEYSTGAAKQTLRRKARVALRAGVTWRVVEDPAERRRLREMADEQERHHPDALYRIREPDSEDLLHYPLWLAAYRPDGRPILLAVTPVDGRTAVLRYFRTLEHSDLAGATRYLMTQVLAEELVRRGMRYLFDSTHPLWLPNGLRHFQRMMGYRLARVVVRTCRASATAT